MPPTGGETGDHNFELDGQLWYWNRQARLGKAFDSSTGFRLPKGGLALQMWRGYQWSDGKR
jgi:Uma2 family endonuclease